jgi:hypothetical protein
MTVVRADGSARDNGARLSFCLVEQVLDNAHGRP